MPDGQVLEFTGVTKSFGDVAAVSDFSAKVEPGVVTGFLGPNGAGKTTTLRILLGLVRPTAGRATIGGMQHSELRQPLRTVGFVLEDTTFRPRRTAVRHLMIAAKANGIPLSRVGEVLGIVGLADEADLRIGGFSLGMRQRLSVASALLGDPGVLVLDEPANGLDPEGIRWMRLLMRRLADEGRTVLVSSHVLSEVQQVADSLLIISHGRLVFSGGIEDLADPTAGPVAVDATDRASLAAALRKAGLEFEVLRSGLNVRGVDATAIGTIASQAGVVLTSLQQRAPGLEDVFLDLVSGTWEPAKTPVVAASAAASSQEDVGASETPDTDEEPAGSDPVEDEPAEKDSLDGDDAPRAEDAGDDAEPDDADEHPEDESSAHAVFGAAALGATAAGTAGLDERTFDATAFGSTVDADDDAADQATDADGTSAEDPESDEPESEQSESQNPGPEESTETRVAATIPETGIPGAAEDMTTEKVGLAIAAAAREYFAKDAEEALGDTADDTEAVAADENHGDTGSAESVGDDEAGDHASWDVSTALIPVQGEDAASDTAEPEAEAAIESEQATDSALDAAAAEFGEQPSFVDPTSAEDRPVVAEPDDTESEGTESADSESDGDDAPDEDSPFTITSLIRAVSTGPVETTEEPDAHSSQDADAHAENDDSSADEHAPRW